MMDYCRRVPPTLVTLATGDSAGTKNMMVWLNKAKKAGYFKVKEHTAEFRKSEDFEKFRTDAELSAFTKRLR